MNPIQVPIVTSQVQLYGTIVICFTQVLLAAIGLWGIYLQRGLHHEMNSMKDALVKSTASASHAEGFIAGKADERERIQNVDEKLREMRGNGP